MIDPYQEGWDYKKDMQALVVALSGAFWIGLLLGDGTLGFALFTGLTLYIGIRMVQLWPFIIIREKPRHESKRQNRNIETEAQENTSRVRGEPLNRIKEEETSPQG
jgi:hypothetical protein